MQQSISDGKDNSVEINNALKLNVVVNWQELEGSINYN